jgi:hypothetical protein
MKKPTKTEVLFNGPDGSDDPKDPFRLERDLIDPAKWNRLYSKMPRECQRLIDRNEQQIGIGRNDCVGWFILGCGQGPFVIWTEK